MFSRRKLLAAATWCIAATSLGACADDTAESGILRVERAEANASGVETFCFHGIENDPVPDDGPADCGSFVVVESTVDLPDDDVRPVIDITVGDGPIDLCIDGECSLVI